MDCDTTVVSEQCSLTASLKAEWAVAKEARSPIRALLSMWHLRGSFACRPLIPNRAWPLVAATGCLSWRWRPVLLKLAGIFYVWDLYHLPSLTEHKQQVQKCRVGTDNLIYIHTQSTVISLTSSGNQTKNGTIMKSKGLGKIPCF